MMDAPFRSQAGRPSHRSGFALLELLVALAVLSILTTLVLQETRFTSEAFFRFPSQYTRIKSEAILTGETTDYEDETEQSYPAIRFQENGTINQARTLTFDRGSHTQDVVLELGPGTLVIR